MLKRIFFLLAAVVIFCGIALPARTALAYDELKNTDPDKYYILLDLKNQIVTVFEKDDNGEYTKVVRRFICTSGRTELDPLIPEDEGTPTPSGLWKIGGRERFGEFTAFRGTYAQYWTQIVGGVYFHSIMYDSADANTLQSGAFRRLGSKGSHGCVRLYVEDAKWLYYYACPGTTINVSNTEKSDSATKKLLKTKMSFSEYKAFQKTFHDAAELPNPKAWIVKDEADVRTGNGNNDRVVKRLPLGTEVEVLQIAEPWAKVKLENREGYIRTAYITFQQDVMMSKEDADILKRTVYIYAEPNEDSEKLSKVPEYSSITVTEPDKDGWTKIRYWNAEGYVETNALTKGWGVIHDAMDEIMPSETYKQAFSRY